MTNYPLSICMPSNRSHQGSRASISTAINFCDLSGSELVVSDNSNDIDKSNMWGNINLDFFKYNSNTPEDTLSNWYDAQTKSNGLYTCMLSDDDLILNIDKPI